MDMVSCHDLTAADIRPIEFQISELHPLEIELFDQLMGDHIKSLDPCIILLKIKAMKLKAYFASSMQTLGYQ